MNQERLMKVLLSPIVSEKSTQLAEKRNQVAFRIMEDATKALASKLTRCRCSIFPARPSVLAVSLADAETPVKLMFA